MYTVENEQYTKDYLDEEKRSIANAVQIIFEDGSKTEEIAIEYPLGHRFRRGEAIPFLEEKYLDALKTRFPSDQAENIFDLSIDSKVLRETSVNEFMERLMI